MTDNQTEEQLDLQPPVSEPETLDLQDPVPYASNYQPITAQLSPEEQAAANGQGLTDTVLTPQIQAGIQGAKEAAALGAGNYVDAGLTGVGVGIIKGVNALGNALGHPLPEPYNSAIQNSDVADLASKALQRGQEAGIQAQAQYPNEYNAGQAVGAMAPLMLGQLPAASAPASSVKTIGDILSRPFHAGFGVLTGAATELAQPTLKMAIPTYAAWIGGKEAGNTLIQNQRPKTLSAQNIDQYQQQLGGYYPILKDAAAKGGNQLAVQTYVLQQKDPQFNQLYTDLQNGMNDRSK